MLYRKITSYIEDHLLSRNDKILVIQGARQIGKSFSIREVGKRLFPNFHEINFVRDEEGAKIFKQAETVEDFYLLLDSVFGCGSGNYDNTLIFLDEIQQYPQYLTWLKFLREDRRYRFIASGSMLGTTLRHTTSVPVGSIILKDMYQLNFEEFLIANNFGSEALEAMRKAFCEKRSLSQSMHTIVMQLFCRYLIVGGMPDAVNTYLDSHNIREVRTVQSDIHTLYEDDASKYESDTRKKLLVRRIYDMIPSQMENKKKRIVAKEIQGAEKDRFDRYEEEFEYLISSGIALGVHAVTNPVFPLSETMRTRLIKLYLNDVGLLTNALYRYNIKPILDTERSVNLGAVYESVVAQELKAHGHRLFYFDRRKIGEVDFIIDDYAQTCTLPIEVKSGKDYTVHSALNRLIEIKDYGIKNAIVLSNEREIKSEGAIIYLPVYFVMFLDSGWAPDSPLFF